MYKKCRTLQSAQRQMHIIQVLVEMMQHSTFEEISVSSLCEHAGIPRKTFYRYFDSKESLLQAAMDSLQNLYHRYSVQRRNPEASVEEDLELFFSFWSEYREFLSAIRYSQMSNLLLENVVTGAFKERKGNRMASYFAVTGLYGVLLEWAYNGFQKTPSEMAHDTLPLFMRPLSETLFH